MDNWDRQLNDKKLQKAKEAEYQAACRDFSHKRGFTGLGLIGLDSSANTDRTSVPAAAKAGEI